MAQTVVGIFDDASEAQTAVQELMEAGFSRSNIDMSAQTTSDTHNNASTDYRTSDDHHREKEGGIVGFFKSLFGDDDSDRDNYTTVGERHSIVTVHAQNDDEAERAADILDDAGAIDVDERAEQYRSGTYPGSMNSGAGGGMSTASGMESGSGMMSNSGLGTGVSADPLAPAYGATTGVTTGSGAYDDSDMNNPDRPINSDRDQDSSMAFPSNPDGSRTIPVGDGSSMGQSQQMGDRDRTNRRSRIFDRPMDETYRMREDRSEQWNNPMEQSQSNADRENMMNTNTGYNRTVDPESDVTNR